MKKIELTSRERWLRTCRHQEIDRMMMVDSAWAGTVARWKAEGMPADANWRDYFGFDRIADIRNDNSPRCECKILEETDRYVIRTTKWGMTEKAFKELDATFETLDLTYTTPEKWEEAKARMLEYHEDRIPWKQLENEYASWEKEGLFRQLTLWFGFDVAHSHLTGTENMLIAMYEDPDWVMDIYDTYLNTSLDLAQKVLDAGYQFDGVKWYDDMGYKGSPFFSVDLYREVLKPFHKKAVDWAHERGLVVELHSCGYIEPFIPDLVEIGIDVLNPLEIKAGMDPHKLKAMYGDKLAFHGGINAQIWDKPELVKEEMERIIPVMKEGGGYIFASDHSIPNSVSLQNMKEIADLARKLGKY
ncbi:MAG: hypothetical protein E7668_03290 [Ruminococcaceae bacterium]|nr:hypothetical protein [Oscillospiraceae bacterium]